MYLVCILLFAFTQTVFGCSIYLLFFFEVELIYNIVLVSGVQQSDSVTHTYAHTYYSFSGYLPR